MIKLNLVEDEDLELYQYGLELVLMKALHFVSYFLIALLIGEILNLVVFLLAFVPLRQYAGGYHAETPLRCYFISLAVVVTALLSFHFELNYLGILGVVSAIMIYMWVPVENHNKPLEESEKTVYKKRARRLIIIQVALIFILSTLGYQNISSVIGCSLLVLLLAMIAGKIKYKHLNKLETIS